MKLTREDIMRLMTPAGGFTKASTVPLGVEWPLRHGWIDRLVGTEVDEKVYAQALANKNKLRPMTLKLRRKYARTEEQFELDLGMDQEAMRIAGLY